MLSSLNTLSLRASYAVMTFLSAPAIVSAQSTLFGEVPDIGGLDAGSEDAVRDGILDILFTVLRFMALVAVIVIVIAGIRLVVSQGEEGEKDKAKKAIFYAIIGLIVILIAQAIVSFIADVVADTP